MQKEMATIEQVAQDNHERARRLMKELNQMQHEYTELKKQVHAPGGPPLVLARGGGGFGRHAHSWRPQTSLLKQRVKRSISLWKL